MPAENREPKAPESYATFWEPQTSGSASANTATAASHDAYSQFVEITESTPANTLSNRA